MEHTSKLRGQNADCVAFNISMPRVHINRRKGTELTGKRSSRAPSILNFDSRRRRRQLHAPASLSPKKRQPVPTWCTLLTVWTLHSCGNHSTIPLSSSPQSLYRLSYPGLRNTRAKWNHLHITAHTHTHTHTFLTSYDVSLMTLKRNVTAFLQKMFHFCKSACKQFRLVTMNCLMSREGGFNKGNLRDD